MNTFLVLGSETDGQLLIYECLPDGVTCWTLHKEAKVGDRILFYITAPVSGIVAMGKVTSDPEYQANPDSDWHKHYLGVVAELEKTRGTTMRELRRIFPEWKQIFYLRQNAKVPAEIIEPLLELLEVQ